MQDLLNIFRALSDETRLRILKLLEKGELCVCDIVAALDIIQPKVSFHLSILKEAGLIKDRKQGKWVHYKIDDSDFFRRFLLLSALERISEELVKEDIIRLKEFLKIKNQKSCKYQSLEALCCKS
ncbi:MAG: metalloregulator ArsR/SmtB family transcription factor [Nitrospirae bacterium]|nr:metalloregulator ArsR/SmtB family transcription factor [Nitrospirota bacterium]